LLVVFIHALYVVARLPLRQLGFVVGISHHHICVMYYLHPSVSPESRIDSRTKTRIGLPAVQ